MTDTPDPSSPQSPVVERLLATLAEAGAYAEAQGLTPEILDELLSDES